MDVHVSCNNLVRLQMMCWVKNRLVSLIYQYDVLQYVWTDLHNTHVSPIPGF